MLNSENSEKRTSVLTCLQEQRHQEHRTFGISQKLRWSFWSMYSQVSGGAAPDVAIQRHGIAVRESDAMLWLNHKIVYTENSTGDLKILHHNS